MKYFNLSFKKDFLFVTFSLFLILLVFSLYPVNVRAYGECSEYGVMATYDYLSNSCQCMSGYAFSSKYGTTQCVSANSICTDKYGYNSRYNSLSNSCECSYGYEFGKDSIGRTQCISLDNLCKDELGYSSSYNNLSNQCECDYGYFIKGGQCVHGANTCRATYGLNSTYNNSSKKCECDTGYTLDQYNQCVEKQNNVYFTLKELDTDDKKAIIKSDYDYKYYLISYNSGCYSSSFKRYLNHQIVVNLGTDYSLDKWDKIVLQDDDETCDITQKELVDSSTTLLTEEEPVYYYTTEPAVPITTPAPAIKTSEIPQKTKPSIVKKVENNPVVITTATTNEIMDNASNSIASTSTTTLIKQNDTRESFLKKINNWFKKLFR